MCRYLIVSDIHRKINNFKLALEDAYSKPLDGVIIAGDMELDVTLLVELIKAMAPEGKVPSIHLVKGNCDGSNAAGIPDMTTFEINENIKVLLTHGHKYMVKSDLDTLTYVASYQNANLVIYGHTHEYDDHIKSGIRFLNPGSIGSGYYGHLTYMLMSIEKGNRIIIGKKELN